MTPGDDALDDLDRALFSLPLEEPPADLRATILAHTTRAPRHVPFRAWEFGLLGGMLAVVAWLAIVAQLDLRGMVADTLTVVAGLRPLGSLDAALWLAVGVAVSAVSLSRLGTLVPAGDRARGTGA